jgi:FAD dependent oxidoreductase
MFAEETHHHHSHHPETCQHTVHIVVLGDELESLLTAISIAHHSEKATAVTVLRQSKELLGGLSTRGGLSYMDLTPEYLSPQLGAFLKQAGLKRVALNAEIADALLHRLLKHHGIELFSGVGNCFPVLNQATHHLTGVCTKVNEEFVTFPADFIVDATPDLRFSRLCGIPYIKGLGGVFGSTEPELNTLGVSPVFRIQGITYQQLQAFEASLRANGKTPHLLKTLCPWMTEKQREDLIHRSTYAPGDSDYVDILNPIIGLHFHDWYYGESVLYELAPFWIDGANVSRLSDGTLGFNGLIGRLPHLNAQLEASEEGLPVPPQFLGVLEDVEAFFKDVGGFSTVQILPPAELYIRQTVQCQAEQVLSAVDLFSGGVPAETAIGTFSYWLDFRGVHPWLAYPQLHPLPKPVFNVGLSSQFPKADSELPQNLAFISRAAGYSPLAQGACRIIQHNCLIGEALGIAIAESIQQEVHPKDIAPAVIREKLADWAKALGEPPPLPPSGKPTWDEQGVLRNHPLILHDVALAEALYALPEFGTLTRLPPSDDEADDEEFDEDVRVEKA